MFLVQILMLSLAKLKLVYHHASRDIGKMGIAAHLADNFAFFAAALPIVLNVKMDSMCLLVLEVIVRAVRLDARHALLLHVQAAFITIDFRVDNVLVSNLSVIAFQTVKNVIKAIV